MDIISQLQEQVNTIANLAFNTFGTLQRDATPVRLSQNYPEPEPPANPAEETAPNTAEQPKEMSAALVKAAKQFDALVNALPLAEGGEEAQMKRIADLQAENDSVGQELQRELEAAEKELKEVQINILLIVMNKYGAEESWTTQCAISCFSFAKRIKGIASNGKILVEDFFGLLYWFDPATQRTEDLAIRDVGDVAMFHMKAYTESLVLLGVRNESVGVDPPRKHSDEGLADKGKKLRVC